MDRKKIAILINSLESGGAERVVSNLLNYWADKYKCYLILIHNDIFYKIDSRVKVITLNEPNNVSGIDKFLKLPLLAYKLSKIIKKYEFESVISFLSRANYINIMSNKFIKHKTIISERNTPSIQYRNNGIKGIINRFLIKNLYPKADLCLSNSYGNMMDLKNNFNIKNIKVIYNPLDIDKINNLSEKEIDIKKEGFTFVTVGRIVKEKNHKLLINAIKDIDANLWIIGDGELKEELEKHIYKLSLKDKVKLLGRKENPFAYMSKADCFVFASNFEGFPNVLIEALACGLPIISTDCKSGPREILAPGTDVNSQLKDRIEIAEYGILTPVGNKEKMQEAMNIMIKNSSIRENYINKARKRAENFKIEKIAKQYEKFIFEN